MQSDKPTIFETLFKFIDDGGQITIGRGSEYPYVATAIEHPYQIVSLVRLRDESIEELMIRLGNSITQAVETGKQICDDLKDSSRFLKNRFSAEQFNKPFAKHVERLKEEYRSLLSKKIIACERSFDDELKHSASLLDSGEDTMADLFGVWVETMAQSPTKQYRALLQLVFSYTALAEQLFIREQIDKAMDALNGAIKYLGQAIDVAKTSLPTDEEFISARARLGGQARAKKYNPIKDKVANLLEVNCPEGGWQSKEAAFKSIRQEIEQFIGDNDDLLRRDGLYNRVMEWSRSDETVRLAFDRYVTRKKSGKAT